MYLSSERLPLAAHHPKPSTNNTTSKPGGRGRSRTLKRYSKLFGAIAIHSLHTGPPSIYISIRSSICGMRLCKATDHLLTVRQWASSFSLLIRRQHSKWYNIWMFSLAYPTPGPNPSLLILFYLFHVSLLPCISLCMSRDTPFLLPFQLLLCHPFSLHSLHM